eukprot:3691397-Pyramimonas_sp.AAC.1
MAIVDAEHRRMCKEVSLAIMFDDRSLRMAGAEAEVGIYLGQAAGSFVIFGRSDKLRCAIELNMGEGAFARAGETKNLGVDCAMEGRSKTVAGSRLRTGCAQADRVQQIRGSSK